MICHLKARFVEYTFGMCDLISTESFILSIRKSVIQRDNHSFVKLEKKTFNECMNPFEITDEENHLYCLASGKPASQDVEKDLLHDR